MPNQSNRMKNWNAFKMWDVLRPLCSECHIWTLYNNTECYGQFLVQVHPVLAQHSLMCHKLLQFSMCCGVCSQFPRRNSTIWATLSLSLGNETIEWMEVTVIISGDTECIWIKFEWIVSSSLMIFAVSILIFSQTIVCARPFFTWFFEKWSVGLDTHFSIHLYLSLTIWRHLPASWSTEPALQIACWAWSI